METDSESSNLVCKLGILSRPDGSALMTEGATTVIAGMYGPVEVKLQKLQIDKASVECHYRPKSGLPGVEDRLYESIIRNICETSLVASLYPRTAILITLQELQNSGHLISCAINAACLACLNAGIDMKFMFAAVSCYLSVDGELSLSSIPEKDMKAMFVFVFNSSEKRILSSHTKGCFSKDHFEEAVTLSAEGSTDVFELFKSAMLGNI